LFMEEWAMRGAFVMVLFLMGMSWWSSGGYFGILSVVPFVLTVILLTAINLELCFAAERSLLHNKPESCV